MIFEGQSLTEMFVLLTEAISAQRIKTIFSGSVLFWLLWTQNLIWDKEEEGLLLHMRWCHCTSSSQDRCWPGTTGKFYTAASSSEPSFQRYHQYQSLSPGFKQTITHTHRQRETYKSTQSIKLINCGSWRSKSDISLWEELYHHCNISE